MLELDATDESHLEGLADAVREHVDGLDGVVPIAFGNPETLLGGSSCRVPAHVAQAVQVLGVLPEGTAMACHPLDGTWWLGSSG